MPTDLVRSYVSAVFGVALLLFSAGSAQANSDVTEIKRLIESQNIEKAFERIKEFQAGKPKLLPEVQLLFGDLYLALEQQRPATLDIARKIATSFASSTQTPSNVCTVFTVLWLLDHLDQVQALQADLESAVTLLTSRYSARGWC